MNLRRLIAVAKKESLHIIRDSRSLYISIALPMILLLLYGYALTLDVDRVPMVIWDQSESTESRELISRFTGSHYFTAQGHLQNYQDVERAIDSRQALAAIIIPKDFSQRLGARQNAPVQFIVDGTDANTATLAMGYAEVVTLIYSQEIILQKMRQLHGRVLTVPIEVRARAWFNPDLESKNYIIPGLIAVIMMVIAALLTSLTVAREWEMGTMEQLISTPVKGPELITGKLIPYMILGLLDVLLAVLMGEYLFQVPLRGNVGLLFAMAAVFLAGALSLGMMISIVAKSQMLASQAAIVVTFLPSFLLSGFIFAISNMPTVIQWATYLVPARYFITLLKGIYLKGIGLEILGMEAVLLAMFGIAVVGLANFKFKRTLG
ncbi:MAG: ABC transporter permease [Nitrospinaceae bacterium]|nr:ABC transporter permease [Nitrospinaceae bacterium]NIR56505.1 ABC transporter permease [Nitrospinaceae bacterium]NIS86963.1 ABC transporter permease [Nitrospinaceae bacterium]NIT83807.1 ABC transporter permease [Nitrospinaceae bacterium]NIU46013.1 ABC transporter permease [Nitrospinaceae bacterium]